MTLDQLIPEKPTFTLSATKKTYTLKIPTIEDRVKFRRLAGGDAEIQKAFTNLNWELISKFAYIMLEDKSDFLAGEVEEINDEGFKVKHMVTGPEKLMRVVTTVAEANSIIYAMVAAIVGSDPEAKKAAEEGLKTVPEEKKTLQ